MRKKATYLIAALLFIMAAPSIALFPKRNSGEPPYRLEFTAPKPKGRYYPVLDAASNRVLNLTPLEYIKGVVAGEMPISYHPEALKAQAVAAHSYTLSQLAASIETVDESLNGALLSTDPDRFQSYLSEEQREKMWGKNFSVNEKLLTDAVSEVINEVMSYDGAPIAAAFFAVSSGVTESAQNVWGREIPYLIPVKSEGDLLSPQYESEVILTDSEVAEKMLARYPDIKFSRSREKWFTDIERTESGNISSVKIGSEALGGTEARDALSLKSANFSVEWKNNSFVFTVRGYGHDVGMSQYGADYMARQGADYRKILSHYYSGISFTAI